MNTIERLFGWRQALDHPVSLGIAAGVGALLLLAPLLIALVNRLARPEERLRRELWQRYASWLVIAPAVMLPVLAGAAWTVLAVTALSLACCAEYARATGLFREKLLSALVVGGILALNFAALDHWYSLFAALVPLWAGLLVVAGILRDRPQGYIQRVALALLGFMLFGAALAHLSLFANDANYRPMLLMLLLCVQLNDVFAFCVGKTFGHRKLAPNTSPGKTLAGGLGALLLTTLLAVAMGRLVFAGTAAESWPLLVLMGVMISVLGQLGDLTLSSIKRDLGIKDMGALLPGHGGVLDRFNSLLLAAPALFHLAHYLLPAVGHGQAARIITGG